MIRRRFAGFRVSLVLLFSIALGGWSQSGPATPNAEAVAQQLRAIADAGTLADLKYLQFPGLSPTRSSPVRGGELCAGVGARWTTDIQAQAMIMAFGVSRTRD